MLVFEYEKYSAISHNINGKDIIMYKKMRQTEIITKFMYPLKFLFSSKLGVNHSYHKKRVRGEQMWDGQLVDTLIFKKDYVVLVCCCTVHNLY